MTIKGVWMPRRTVAVVDTNVLMDVYSCTDLTREYLNPNLPLPEAARSPEAIFRRARARESLLLCWYFHRSRSRTFGLIDEHVQAMRRAAPPENVHQFETHFTTWFVWFVKDYVLGSWIDSTYRSAGVGLKNRERDDLLIATAQENALPLITNEGYSPAGISDADRDKIRAKALALGVKVYTPRQFCEAKFGMGTGGGACRAFLRKFGSQAPRFVKGRSEHTARTIAVMGGYYAHILFGMTREPGLRLPVRF